jgi:hypothetical protein
MTFYAVFEVFDRDFSTLESSLSSGELVSRILEHFFAAISPPQLLSIKP